MALRRISRGSSHAKRSFSPVPLQKRTLNSSDKSPSFEESKTESSQSLSKLAPLRASASVRKSSKSSMNWIANNQWRLGEKIGSGSFGEVFQGLNESNGKLFAVKRLNVQGKPEEMRSLIHEIQLMRELSHEHIVEYLGAKVDEEQACVYIFQEWVPGGSVAHLLKRFGPFKLGIVGTYTRQILQGLVYLHEHGIIHRHRRLPFLFFFLLVFFFFLIIFFLPSSSF